MYMCVCMYVLVHVYMYICIYIYMCVCMYVCVYVKETDEFILQADARNGWHALLKLFFVRIGMGTEMTMTFQYSFALETSLLHVFDIPVIKQVAELALKPYFCSQNYLLSTLNLSTRK